MTLTEKTIWQNIVVVRKLLFTVALVFSLLGLQQAGFHHAISHFEPKLSNDVATASGGEASVDAALSISAPDDEFCLDCFAFSHATSALQFAAWQAPEATFETTRFIFSARPPVPADVITASSRDPPVYL